MWSVGKRFSPEKGGHILSSPNKKAPNPENETKPTHKEEGSDSSSTDSHTLVEPQRSHYGETVRPFFGRSNGRLSRSEYDAAKKDTKENDRELYDQGIVQRKNENGDVTHEIIRKGYRENESGRVVKDDSFSGYDARHPIVNRATGGLAGGAHTAYRSVKPRAEYGKLEDGGASASKKNWLIAGGAVVAVGGAGTGYYFYQKKKEDDALNTLPTDGSIPPGVGNIPIGNGPQLAPGTTYPTVGPGGF